MKVSGYEVGLLILPSNTSVVSAGFGHTGGKFLEKGRRRIIQRRESREREYGVEEEKTC